MLITRPGEEFLGGSLSYGKDDESGWPFSNAVVYKCASHFNESRSRDGRAPAVIERFALVAWI